MFNLIEELTKRGEVFFDITRMRKKKSDSPFKVCVHCFSEIKNGQYYCDVVTYTPSDTIDTKIDFYHLHKNCSRNIQETPMREIIRAREEEKKSIRHDS